MFNSKFFARIVDDFKQRKLLPLKMLFFVQASTVLVLYPYLTIHMRELGINVQETAIMSSITPVVAILMPPMAGIVADRIGNFKRLLAMFSVLGGLAALLLLAVPVGRYTVHYPDKAFLALSCAGGALDLSWADPHPCTAAALAPGAVNLTLEDCGARCLADLQDKASLNRTLRDAPRYTLRLADPAERGADSFTYSTSGGSHHVPRLFAGAVVAAYFPTPGLHTLTCQRNGTALGCSLGRDSAPGDGSPLDRPTSPFSLRAALTAVAGGLTQERRFQVLSLTGGSARNDTLGGKPTCTDHFRRDGRTASVRLPAAPGPAGSLSTCAASCLASAPRRAFCSNAHDLIEVDPSFTFWMYLLGRVFVGVIGGTALAMFEGAVIAILREHHGDYGLQRIYALIGGMISSPLSGFLIDYASQGKTYSDFRPAFYLYAGLKLLSGLLILIIDLKFKAPASNVMSDVLHVLRSVELACLFIVCFLLGTAWGYIESFLFWLIQDLGGSRSLMGLTTTVGGIAGIPLLALSGPIIKKIGHPNVLFIGFIFYAIRLFGYSLIYNPWMCLVFEAMESITSSLSMTAAVTYAATLSSTSTDTSVQGLVGGLYYGVGKGSGSLIGGFLMTAVGTRNTYRVFAVGSLCAGIMYFLFNHFFLRHYKKKDPEKYDKEVGFNSRPDKDQEACTVPEICKDKTVLATEEKPNSSNHNKQQASPASDGINSSVQKKNSRNSQLQQQVTQVQQLQSAAPAASERTERAPLNKTGIPRDYCSSASPASPASPTGGGTPGAAEAGEAADVLRRRKSSSECSVRQQQQQQPDPAQVGFAQEKREAVETKDERTRDD